MKWTTEETAFMYLHLSKEAKEIYTKYVKKFGKQRTLKAIEVKASSLRKKKSGKKLVANTRAVGPNAKPKSSPKPKKKVLKRSTFDCRTCGVELTDENWYPSFKKNGNKQCKDCWNKYLKERKKLKKLLSAKTEKVGSKKKQSRPNITEDADIILADKDKQIKRLNQYLAQRKKEIKNLKATVKNLKLQIQTLSDTAVLSEKSWTKAFEDYTRKMEGLLQDAKKKPLTRRERRKLKKQQRLQAKLEKLMGENNDTV